MQFYTKSDGAFFRIEDRGIYAMTTAQNKEFVSDSQEAFVLSAILNGRSLSEEVETRFSEQIQRWIDKKFVEAEAIQTGSCDSVVELADLPAKTDSTKQHTMVTSLPIYMTLGITSCCNYKCSHCGNDSKNAPSPIDMTPAEIKRILDEMCDIGLLKINFTGGEPTTDENLLDYIRYVKGRIPRITMTSNGSNITIDYALELREAGCNMVKISLDGTAEYHDKFRGVDGAYNHAISGIRNLVSAGIEVRVQTTLTNGNTSEVLQVARLLPELGVSHQSVVPVCPIGRAEQDMMLSPCDYKRFVYGFCGVVSEMYGNGCRTHYQLRPVFGEQNAFAKVLGSEFETMSIKHSCEALLNTMEIQPNGDVVPCSFLNTVIGNVLESSISEIWKSQKAEEARGLFIGNDAYEACSTCERYGNGCNGGCLSNRQTQNAMLPIDPYCFVCGRSDR